MPATPYFIDYYRMARQASSKRNKVKQAFQPARTSPDAASHNAQLRGENKTLGTLVQARKPTSESVQLPGRVDETSEARLTALSAACWVSEAKDNMAVFVLANVSMSSNLN